MRKTVVFLFFIISCISNAQVFNSLVEAKKEALNKNKLILIQYHTDFGYKPLQKLNDECWNDNEIMQLLNNFVVLRIEVFPTPLVKNKKELIAYEPNNKYISIVDANEKNIFFLDYNCKASQVKAALVKFSLSTEFLSLDLHLYDKNKTFNTAIRVSQKYYDFSLLTQKEIKSDILNLANDYLIEANQQLSSKDEDYIYKKQKLDLIKVSRFVYLFEFEKLDKKISKFKESEMKLDNLNYFYFLKYISSKALKKEDFAAIDEKVKTIDDFDFFIKKADFILSKQIQ